MEKFEDGTPNPDGKKIRGYIKQVVLAIMYGKGAQNVGEDLDITREEAQEVINSFYNGFPKVKKWIDRTYKEVEEKGYAETLWGRKRFLPEMQLQPYEITQTIKKPKGFNPLFDLVPNMEVEEEDDEQLIKHYLNQLNKARSFRDRQDIISKAFIDGLKVKDNNGFIAKARRQAINTKIQGAAADVTKRAMVLIHKNERLKELKFQLLLAVHDELIGECPQENADECSKLMSQLMLQSALPECSVPMKCDPSMTHRWYQDDIYDTIYNEYKFLLKGDLSKNIYPISEEEAMNQIKLNHSEITESVLLNMCSDNYNIISEGI